MSRLRFKWLTLLRILLSCAGLTLASCAPVLIEPRLAVVAPDPVRIEAIGYGASSSYTGYTAGQRRLLAIRAARLDAYRSLAEQIYGVRITGSTTVSAMVTQSDSFRSYVDAYLRGARTVTVTSMADGNYEVVVEINLNQDFFNHLQAGGPLTSTAPTTQRVAAQGCTAGVTGPSCPYPAGPYYYREP